MLGVICSAAVVAIARAENRQIKREALTVEDIKGTKAIKEAVA